MTSIYAAVEQIKRNPLEAVDPDLICDLCKRLGHRWRERQLPPTATIGLLLQQVLQGNLSCNAVRHIANKSVSGSAVCQARYRLPLAVYQALLPEVCQAARPLDRQKDFLWHGHRTFHIDGTGFSMPDTPGLRKQFGLPNGVRKGCGFPVAHLLTLFNARSGLLDEAIPAGVQRGDLADVPAILEHLAPGDLLIGDSSFGCYVVLALLQRAQAHGLFSIQVARIVDFTPHRPFCSERQHTPEPGLPHSQWVRSLGKQDQLVRYFKPPSAPDWIDPDLWAELPESILVRELRRCVQHPQAGAIEMTMVTTLLNPKYYSAKALTRLRGCRWGVETNLGHLKTTLRMDVLHCRKPEGIRRELCIFCLAYNLVRLVMLEAARRQRVRPQRISFADALYWLRFVEPGQRLARLRVNPRRPNRVEPRVLKRRKKNFPSMIKPRWQYKKSRKKT